MHAASCTLRALGGYGAARPAALRRRTGARKTAMARSPLARRRLIAPGPRRDGADGGGTAPTAAAAAAGRASVTVPHGIARRPPSHE